MPKMGESIEEATITNWFVKEGDQVVEDDVLLEIATDKVDSEIPSPVAGVVKKIFFKQDEVVAVGTVIAVIDMDGESVSGQEEGAPETTAAPEANEMAATGAAEEGKERDSGQAPGEIAEQPEEKSEGNRDQLPGQTTTVVSGKDRFYSPLVRKIAGEEKITQEELDSIPGSGLNGRVQKRDVLRYLEERAGKGSGAPAAPPPEAVVKAVPATAEPPAQPGGKAAGAAAAKDAAAVVRTEGGDEVIEMSRLRKLIAEHMIRSKQTSAHVTNMIEVDVTGVVTWRNRVKDEFLKKEGVKLTFLPVFLEATVRALKEFPRVNASVEGDRIILKRRINLGVAVALPDYNLIVPNIKDADTLNLVGITKRMNELAAAARNNKLGPDDISGGTFTVTNFGSFQNDIGTPIINQPEVAILAIGAIKKKPAVMETELGDVIAIRHKMWLSLTYDHRIIDGALGGAFLKRLGDYIESFDPENGNFKI
jgi:2-oxoglutarate dehydrogenase E2 component (dihydrolipoamide succinyltransferase)